MSHWLQILRHPFTGAVLLLACVASIVWWLEHDVEWMFMGYEPLVEQPLAPVTSTLLHINVLHLLFNAWWLVQLGCWIERRFGIARAAGLALLWAYGSSLPEVAFSDGGVGLSGVVYAQWAFLSVLRRRGVEPDAPVTERDDQWLIGWFVLCILLTESDIMPVGNFAHAAGALFGAATAMVLPGLRRPWLAVLLLLATLTVVSSTWLRPYLSFSPTYTEQLVYEASLLAEQGRYQEAVTRWHLVLRRTPHDSNAWASLGYANHELGRRDAAGAAFDRAQTLPSANEDSRLLIAWWRATLAYEAFEQGNHTVAVARYRRACTLAPRNADYRRALARLLAVEQQDDQARRSYQLLLELLPGDEEAEAYLDGSGR